MKGISSRWTPGRERSSSASSRADNGGRPRDAYGKQSHAVTESRGQQKGAIMNLKEIKELIEMLKNTDISELEIERSGVKVRLRKGGDVTYHTAMPRMEYPPAAIVAPAVPEAAAPAAA